MFERLFSLLLHAKSGVFAGVFLIGTTGALVTATVQNGVTTITLTEASPSPSGSASPSPSASASASPSATASHSASPSASTTVSLITSPFSSTSSSPSDCKAKFQAGVDATKRVDTAFVGFHTDLMHLRPAQATDAQRKTVENADKLLKQIRESAVKAIHASTSCFKRDDDDKMDKHEDQDENDNDDADKNDEQKGEHEDKPRTTPPAGTDTFRPVLTVTPTPTPATVIGTSTDPKTIADNAVAAMKLVFDTAKAGLPTPVATSTKSPKSSRSPEPKTTTTNGHNGNNGKDVHGKGDD